MSAFRVARSLVASSSRSWAQRSLTQSASGAFARSTLAARSVSASWTGAQRQFSVSRTRWGEGSTDAALAQKLSEELAYENEAAQAGTPEFVKEFQSHGIWSIIDNKGADEVTLERTFGNETIRLMFSVADLDAQPENEVEMEGETEEGETVSQSVSSSPLRVAITLTKRGSTGAMNVDAVCQDGAFLVENVSFYADAETGTALTAEADWKRRGLYLGPTFENLDPAVQDEFERFLEERGINEALALFIPDFAEHKEQTEYVRWLEGIKKFIES